MFLFAETPYIYTTVVQEVYNQDCSPEVDDVEGLAAAAMAICYTPLCFD
jgi:hypothetical protein